MIPILLNKNQPQIGCSNLIKSFLSGRKSSTIEAYRRDLQDFSNFLHTKNIDEAAAVLLSSSHGQANSLGLVYKNHLIDSLKLSSASVNRRLAALRSLVKLARTMGLVSWEMEVQNQKHSPYRDVTGIGISGINTIFRMLQSRSKSKSVRDYAILRLLYDLGLRRNEVCVLDLNDLNLAKKTIAILGKGQLQKQILSLAGPTIEALKKWLAIRGMHNGPMFFRLDKASDGSLDRLTGTGLYSIIRSIGEEVGIRKISVHRIRHDAITTALKVAAENNIGLDDVKRFSRHCDVKTLLIYKDEIEDMQGKLAELVAKTGDGS